MTAHTRANYNDWEKLQNLSMQGEKKSFAVLFYFTCQQHAAQRGLRDPPMLHGGWLYPDKAQSNEYRPRLDVLQVAEK